MIIPQHLEVLASRDGNRIMINKIMVKVPQSLQADMMLLNILDGRKGIVIGFAGIKETTVLLANAENYDLDKYINKPDKHSKKKSK